MTLKVGMRHWILEYYQVCSNDDPGLILTYFTARSNLVPYAFVWEEGKIMNFLETIVVCDIKVGRFSLLNEYMNFMNIKGQGHSLTFVQSHSDSTFQTSFAQKPLGRLKPNFIWSLHGMWGMKMCSTVPGHMTMPIYGERLQKSSSSEPRGWWP